MANNVMCLRCVPCDETFLLAKYYPTLTNGWFQPTGWARPNGPLQERDTEVMDAIVDRYQRLEAFLEKHSFCENAGGDFNSGNRRFDLTFEVPAVTG